MRAYPIYAPILILALLRGDAAHAEDSTPNSLDLPFARDSSVLLSLSGLADQSALEMMLKFEGPGGLVFSPYIQGKIESGEKETSILTSKTLVPGLRIGFRLNKDFTPVLRRAELSTTELGNFRLRMLEQYPTVASRLAICEKACARPRQVAFCQDLPELKKRLAPQDATEEFKLAETKAHVAKLDSNSANLVQQIEDEEAHAALSRWSSQRYRPPELDQWRLGLTAYTAYSEQKFQRSTTNAELHDVDVFDGFISLEFEHVFGSWAYGVSLQYETVSNANAEEICTGEGDEEECVTGTRAGYHPVGTIGVVLALEVLPGWRNGDRLFGMMPYLKFSDSTNSNKTAKTLTVGLPMWMEAAETSGSMYGLRAQLARDFDAKETLFTLGFFVGADFTPLDPTP